MRRAVRPARLDNLGDGRVSAVADIGDEAAFGFAFVLVSSSLLNVLYFFPVIYNAFFVKNPRFSSYDEAPASLWGPPVFTAVVSIVIGIAPNVGPGFWTFASRVTESVFGGGG